MIFLTGKMIYLFRSSINEHYSIFEDNGKTTQKLNTSRKSINSSSQKISNKDNDFSLPSVSRNKNRKSIFDCSKILN